MMSEIVTEVMVLPDGMEPGDIDASTFAVKVRWRGARTETGRGGYAVTTNSGRHLSHKGKWRWEPEPFIQRHYRWESLESALTTARAVVNDVRVNGRTWHEWRAQREGASDE